MKGQFVENGGPLWMTLIDEVLYVVAALIFVIGSYDFYPGVPFVKYVEGCELFIIGSAIFLGLALFNGFEIYYTSKLSRKPPDAVSLFEEWLYVAGSALFLVGTFLFTPDLSDAAAESAIAIKSAAAAGAATPAATPDPLLSVQWFGQTFDLVMNDQIELPEPTDQSIEEGDLLFVGGSILFSMAAFVSGLKAAGDSAVGATAAMRRRVAVAVASLYELGGVAFVVGTLGFIPASALGITQCPEGVAKLTDAGATLFVGGSALYLVGSLLTLVVSTWVTYDPTGADAAFSPEVPYSLRTPPPSGSSPSDPSSTPIPAASSADADSASSPTISSPSLAFGTVVGMDATIDDVRADPPFFPF